MLKLLLDEHLALAVAAGLRRYSSLIVVCLAEWENGALLGQADSACLQQAAAQGLTLVTYDRRTIPALLKAWGEEGRKRGGVIFVDEKTISPADVGALVQALSKLWRKAANGSGLIESAFCGADWFTGHSAPFPESRLHPTPSHTPRTASRQN